jgi:hypothetical protein
MKIPLKKVAKSGGKKEYPNVNLKKSSFHIIYIILFGSYYKNIEILKKMSNSTLRFYKTFSYTVKMRFTTITLSQVRAIHYLKRSF